MSATLIYNGNPLVLQAGEFHFDPRTGWHQTIKARGLTASANALAMQMVALGFKVTNTNLGNGTGEITYELNSLQGNPEVPQDLWQLPGALMQKSIFEFPDAIALDTQYPGILAAIQDQNPLFTNGACNVAYTPNPAALTDWRFQWLTYLIGRGTDHFDYSQYGLRHTQTISQVYPGDINDTNSENVYTTTQLLAECASFPTPLPQRLIDKINAIDTAAKAGFAAPTGYTWGWKKSPSSENMTANSKIEVTTDYQYDLWNTGFLYNLLGTGAPEV